MEDNLKQLTDTVWVITAATNTGIIRLNDRECLLIDPGSDKDSAKNVMRALATLSLEPSGALITHAHADHYGACAYLKGNTMTEFLASAFESSLIEQPLLEPIFLFGGAEPIPELTHKFVLAKPVPISQRLAGGVWEYRGCSFKIVELPGHSPGQIGVEYDGLLFAGDALMLSEYIRKFKFPFYTNVETALRTLNLILGSSCHTLVPGHGRLLEPDAYRREAEYNSDYLNGLLEMAVEQLRPEPLTAEELLRKMALRLETSLATPIQYALDRTLVLAILRHLCRNNQLEMMFRDNLWFWRLRE